MSLSMYDASIPVLIRGLGIMSHYLDTAAAYAVEKNIPVSVLLQARLAPDMLPLAGQVQRAKATMERVRRKASAATLRSCGVLR